MVKAVCLESRGSLFRPALWHPGLKGTNVSSPLNRKDSVLGGASVTEGNDISIVACLASDHQG